ncbi:prolyl 3-hydroxylase OGFOD1 [Carettochelys insculpta]|uniref:prolyl 3-hydroxylase OGFOD1 n=1 Tax=Carettochelys insculpta TaxID=44489 RepID=UPI003EB96897
MSGRRRGPRAGDAPYGEPGKKRDKRELRGEFSAAIKERALREKAAAAWGHRDSLSHEAIAVDPVPFSHCVIPNFIQCSGFLDGLREELLGLDFHEKCNDLYKFKQSDDLRERKEPHISALRKVLFEEFREWLSVVTQVELEPTVDLSCAKYEYTDALLCHDDELEGRRIAFILYLVPPWEKGDGGTLDLYSTDGHFQPQQVVKSLVPTWNSLVFFEVSPVSFHQVSEVLTKGKCRLSVSGWFHGLSVARPPRYIESLLPRSPHIPYDHEILQEWINPVYLSMNSQAQIQEEFEERSEILLKNFLKGEKFQLVCEALQKEDIKWSSRGPPNKRYYHRAEEGSLPDILRRSLEFFRSEALFLLLSNFTGLKLHFLASSAEEEEEEEEGRAADCAGHSSSKPKQGESSQEADSNADHVELPEHAPPSGEGSSVPMCMGELRHWTNGHYTLVHDTQVTEFALDLLFFCGCEDWEAEYGGFTAYIAKDEDEELLTVNPENNCLALVYRDKETLKFVKYVNHCSLERMEKHPSRAGFWDFSFVYYE